MGAAEGFEDFEHFKGRKLRNMKKIDLSGHQSGMLKLTGRTVLAPFQRAFGVKVMDGEGEKKKNEQEDNVVSFYAFWNHRILCAYNIREKEERCQPGKP
jgi:hypothetical protein